MATYYDQNKYNSLREEYDFFRFQRYDYTLEKDSLYVKFYFSLNDEYFFTPSFEIAKRKFYDFNNLGNNQLDTILFNIGMIELISYWKLACPRKVYITPFRLSEEQIKWWKKLYFNGLGEFFYLNGIKENVDDFMEIICESDISLNKINIPLSDATLVPVGGGKDSVVTLELLKNKLPVIPLIINPRGATNECVKVAGFSEEQVAVIKRTLDSTMLRMNNEGFLNGHTPFSAMLAFYTLLIGFATNSKYIALSNESSANEPTVPDSEINHQYSKSIAFENDFRDYVNKYISSDIEYFSFLRPLNEIQIASLFSRNKDYYKVFKSCNAGSKTDSWCGKCPKCLFTYLIMSPFISQEDLINIFGKDLLNDNDLQPILKQLKGEADVKPFECVGTIEEVNACLNFSQQTTDNRQQTSTTLTIDDLLNQYDEMNNLPEHFAAILKDNLFKNN
ncbi:MAG: hypothetical protein IJE47_00920 [Bacteroidales bacterium]|nr:hypothetical protein [Bacteroidales bacterium]